MKSKPIKHILVLIIFFLCAVYITYPLFFHMGDMVTGYGDELLIAWIQSWVQHQILSHPLNLFDANIYYPYINSLAYSDAFITSSVVSWVPVLVLKQPIVAVNFTLFTSIWLLGFSTYLLAEYLIDDIALSIFSGILVMFSPAVLDKYIAIQILTIYWVPLAVYFFLHFLNRKKTKFLLLTLLCLDLQTYNSFMPGYFISISLFVIALIFYREKKKKFLGLCTKRNILLIILALLIIIPIAIPYYQVSEKYQYTRDIRDTIHFALQPEDLLVANNFSRLEPILNQQLFPEHLPTINLEVKPGFIGAVFLLLSLLTFSFVVRHWSHTPSIYRSFFIISVTGLVLSFGPFLHIARVTIHHPFPIPLPYIFFYYVFPGFQGFRNSARFEMLFVLFAAVLCVWCLQNYIKKKKQIVKNIILLLLFVLTIVEFNFPMHYVPAPQVNKFPLVYTWLKTTPSESKTIEMPIYTWNMQPYVFKENMREYYSTMDFRKMVNGASGYSPDAWQTMVKQLLFSFPKQGSIQYLQHLGINYIIVHKAEYDQMYTDRFVNGQIGDGNTIIRTLQFNPHVHLVKIVNNDYIYQVL